MARLLCSDRRVAAWHTRLCTSLPAVDSTIVVGVVGVVATAVTAWIGSWNTRRATERTVEAGADATRATLISAREDRLWERRAAAYEEALTGLLHRQAKRHFDTRQFRTSDEQQMKEFYESYQLPGVFETESRITAYASDAVMKAHKATRGAHSAVVVAYSHRASLQESRRLAAQTGRMEGAVSEEIMTDAERKLDAALQAADAADQALIEIIRTELRSRPEAALRSSEIPAVRRRFWDRRKAVDD
jgi:hypothetical protein